MYSRFEGRESKARKSGAYDIQTASRRPQREEVVRGRFLCRLSFCHASPFFFLSVEICDMELYYPFTNHHHHHHFSQLPFPPLQIRLVWSAEGLRISLLLDPRGPCRSALDMINFAVLRFFFGCLYMRFAYLKRFTQMTPNQQKRRRRKKKKKKRPRRGHKDKINKRRPSGGK